MKRIASLLSALGLLLFPLISFAAPAPGELIKGSGPAVYYFAVDGKRYVFPTEKTYFTWYDNFDSVMTITDAELAAIPLGANVTYRPGVRMVKIESDPKVYAVAKNGELRWIETEALAESLYGPNWATHIDDIPVGFFTSYTLGVAISSETDFVPTEATNGSLTIQDDRNLMAPDPSPDPEPDPDPEPEPNVTGTLTSSDTSVTSGDVIDVFAIADPAGSIKDVYIYLDDEEKRYCAFSPCGVSFDIPPGETEYELRAEFAWITGETVTKTLPITVESNGGNGVELIITNPEVKPGGIREAIVFVDNSLVADIISIYLDGNIVRTCDDVQECRYSMEEPGEIGDSYSVYARVQNQGNSVVFSKTKKITVVENDHPQLTIRVGNEVIFTGETVDATVEASDSDGIASTEIWIDGAPVKHCDISICTANLGPFSTTGTKEVVGKATDLQGLEQTSTASFEIQ